MLVLRGVCVCGWGGGGGIKGAVFDVLEVMVCFGATIASKIRLTSAY